MRSFLFFLLLLWTAAAAAQQAAPNIASAKLYRKGDQASFPIINLGSTDELELHFDDFDADIKNYYYGYELCNADWTPSVLRTFEYIRGFQNVRINNYRTSSITRSRYTHYQAQVPDRSALPTRSGNYMLKVFLNGDTNQLVFTKRFVVADNKSAVGLQLQQPYNASVFRTHQKVQVAITTDNRLQSFSPQDIKVVILQNNNWRTAVTIDRPTLYRGNYYEYSDEAYTAMQGGKEWRWIDLRSTRLMSDRMMKIDTKKDTTDVFVKPDVSRNGQVYVYYRDLNGSYSIESMESINPFWQADYANVHFTYVPPGGRAIAGRDIYLFGELTNYGADTSGKMEFNEEKGWYEKTLFLKQGFYNYVYAAFPPGGKGQPDLSPTEGNSFSTENNYIVLVYYRPFGSRADELIGSAALHSTFRQ
jgi:hypothetical protein